VRKITAIISGATDNPTTVAPLFFAAPATISINCYRDRGLFSSKESGCYYSDFRSQVIVS